MAASLPRPRPLAVLLLAAFAAPVSAQTATELSEIVVTAKRDEAPGRTGTVTVLKGADLDKRNVTDMANMARYEPLISVPSAASGGGNIWDGAGNTGFNIRGIEGNRVSLDVDGIALPDAAPKPDGNAMNSFGIGRDYFDPETFREVRIGSGTSPAGPGTPGLAGSVAFSTKAPEDYLSDTRRSHAEYKFGYSSANSARMHALTGAMGSGALKALVVLVHRDGEQGRSKGSAAVNPDDWSSDALLGKFSWTPQAGHKFGFTIDAYKAAHDRVFSNKIAASYPDGAVQDSDTTRTRVSLEHQYTPKQGAWADLVDTRFHVQDAKVEDHTVARYLFGQPSMRSIDTGYFNKSIGFASDATKQLDAASALLYGVSLEQLESRRPWREDRLVLATGAYQVTRKNRMADMDTLKLAAYLRGEIGFGLGGYKALLTPGVRVEHRELSPKNTSDYVIAVPSAAKELRDESDTVATPSLALSIDLTPEFSLYAQYSRGTRLPSAAERTGTYDSFSYTGAGTGYAVLGNMKLAKETSNAFEVGLKGAPARGVQLNASLFTNRYKNFIDYVAQPADPVNYPTIVQGLFRPENIGAAKTWGGEVSSRFQLGQWSAPLQGASVALAAGVSHGSASNSRTGKEGGLPTVLPYKGSLELAWDDPARRGGASLTTVHVRAKQAEADVITGTATPTFAVPGSTVMDFSAYWNIGRNATLTVGAYNLGDKKYWDYASARTLVAGTTAATRAEIERYARPGRNYALTLKLIY